MFTIVVDESGDTGVDNVNEDPSPGPTQYFSMCATLFREDNRQLLIEAAERFPWNEHKLKHAKRMGHFDKIHACKSLSTLPVAMVGIVSNKLSLGNYLAAAKQTPTHFYNKVTHYLLERVGAMLGAYQIPKEDVRIVLEAREQQYSSLLIYLKKIQANPINSNAKLLRNIDPFSIIAIKKQDEPCMWVSDLGAHALFSVFRRDLRSHGLTESRYIRELSPVILAKKNGRLLGAGLKFIHSLDDVTNDPEARDMLTKLNNPNPGYCKLN